MSASTAPGACWGCGVCPDAGKSFQFCSKCRDLKLAPSFFCGKDCLTKNWPRHKAWHLVQSDLSAKRANVNALSQAVTAQQQRTLNDAKLAALSQVTNPELRQRIADAKAAVDGSKRPAGKAPVKAPVVDPFVAELAEAEKFRQARELDKALACLKRAALHRPADPRPPFQMCMLQTAMGDVVGACDSALRCVHIAPGGHLGVLPSELTKLGGPKVPRGVYPQIGLRAAVMAFDLLIRPPCDGVARPAWWEDGCLLAMSERALGDTPDSPYALSVRAHALLGVTEVTGAMEGGVVRPRGWALGHRSAAQLREAAGLLKRQATLEPPGSAAAVHSLRRASAALEAAHALEADAAATAGAAQPATTPASAPSPTREAGRGAGAGGDAPAERSAKLAARRSALEEQVAALERQLADVRSAPPAKTKAKAKAGASSPMKSHMPELS